MTTKYVNSGAGGSATGDDWTNAYTTLGAAVTAGADLIKIHSGHSETLGADTTYTLTVATQMISVDKDSSDAPTVGAVVGAGAGTSYSITVAGAFKCFFYGITFRIPGTGAKNLTFGQTDMAHYEFESCKFHLITTGAAAAIVFGAAFANYNNYIKLLNPEFRYGGVGQDTKFEPYVDIIGGSINSSGSVPTPWIVNIASNSRVTISGMDVSHLSGTLVDNNTQGQTFVTFRQCKLHATVTPKAAAVTALMKGNTTVEMWDCASGNTHYGYFHADAFGSTIADAGIYATAGAQSGGAGVSYKTVTTANCSYYTPYTGPWIAKYNTGTSAVTASFEVLRDASATAYQNDEIWGEWQYKGTSGSVLLTTVNDRMAVLGSAADQTTGALAAGDWTGENATAWFGKLHTASTITPAEVGHVYGRVVVGEPSITVYYDPQIRLA